MRNPSLLLLFIVCSVVYAQQAYSLEFDWPKWIPPTGSPQPPPTGSIGSPLPPPADEGSLPLPPPSDEGFPPLPPPSDEGFPLLPPPADAGSPPSPPQKNVSFKPQLPKWLPKWLHPPTADEITRCRSARDFNTKLKPCLDELFKHKKSGVVLKQKKSRVFTKGPACCAYITGVVDGCYSKFPPKIQDRIFPPSLKQHCSQYH